MMTLSGTLPTHGDQIVHMCGLRWVDTSKGTHLTAKS